MFESVLNWLSLNWLPIVTLAAGFFLCFHFLKSLIKAALIIAVLAGVMLWLMRLPQ